MFIKLSLFLAIVSAQTTFAQHRIPLGQPPSSPALFAGNIVSTGLNERDFALSPGGSEIFYTVQSPAGVFQTIFYMKKNQSGNWSKPEVAPFAGKFSDIEPAFSMDGNRLFFSSNRPLSGTTVKDFDIWVVEKKNNIWGEPQNIGEPVNTSANEFYPSVTNSGNLYFTAAYKHSVGTEDIWLAKWENGTYSVPVTLDTAINSKTYEFNAFVSPAEDFIIFTSYGRKDDMGKGDLYMSSKDATGKWLPAKNLSLLNSTKLDYCPFVSFDKKALFFTSDRHTLKNSYLPAAVNADELASTLTAPQNGFGDIYWVSFERVMGAFKE